jgi:hypothetical protein
VRDLNGELSENEPGGYADWQTDSLLVVILPLGHFELPIPVLDYNRADVCI